jgi:hypothetical protein
VFAALASSGAAFGARFGRVLEHEVLGREVGGGVSPLRSFLPNLLLLLLLRL